MKVETYEVVESVADSEIDLLVEDGEKALLIEELGLEGQKNRMGDSKSSHGYRFITAEEKLVFEAVFPKKTELCSYKDSDVPLRVLQVAAHVKSLKLEEMAYFQVWHPEAGKDDPVLVARKNYYSGDIYLLARWGNALMPFEDLKKEAFKILAAKAKGKLLNIQREVKSALENFDDYVMEHLLNDKEPAPYASI